MYLTSVNNCICKKNVIKMLYSSMIHMLIQVNLEKDIYSVLQHNQQQEVPHVGI